MAATPACESYLCYTYGKADADKCFRGFKFSQLEMSKSSRYHESPSRREPNCLRSAEVVLAELLSTYSFELTDKPVAWNASAVMYPTMGEDSTRPELLLKVKAL